MQIQQQEELGSLEVQVQGKPSSIFQTRSRFISGPNSETNIHCGLSK